MISLSVIQNHKMFLAFLGKIMNHIGDILKKSNGVQISPVEVKTPKALASRS